MFFRELVALIWRNTVFDKNNENEIYKMSVRVEKL